MIPIMIKTNGSTLIKEAFSETGFCRLHGMMEYSNCERSEPTYLI